jgi:hypothetical protein
MPNNEYDLILAIMEVGRGDTAPGVGLVALTGKTVPIIRWRDLVQIVNEPPIVAAQIFSADRNSGAPEKLLCGVQFDAIVPHGSEGLESQIADRIETIMTVTNFLAEGLDVEIDVRQRRPLDFEEGRRRIEMDFDMAMKR